MEYDSRISGGAIVQSHEVCFEFMLMGELLEPRAGAVAVDVGGKCVAGVIDHHFAEAGAHCAASLVAERPALVLDHLADAPAGGPLAIVMHREPDLDCLVASYLVAQLAGRGVLPEAAPALAEYALAIDAGKPPPDGICERSLWTLYTAATHLLSAEVEPDEAVRYRGWLARGFELLDILAAARPRAAAEIALPASLPGWERERELLGEERARYEGDRRRAREIELGLPRSDGGVYLARGLIVNDPRAALFKHLARAQGFLFTHVIYGHGRSQPAPAPAVESARHVISVAPEQGVWLRGLGAALEAAEVHGRALRGLERPGPPRWPDVTNSDPWYDGRAPAHGYTIVDTPHSGTVIPEDEVQRIVHGTRAWIALGAQRRESICPACAWAADRPGAVCCPVHRVDLVPAVVAGRFETVSLLGAGGMGMVCKVQDRITSRHFALKLIRRELQRHQDAQRRFVREARMANQVGHRNVARLITLGADATVGLYILSEYLEGIGLERDLADWWEVKRQPYPWPRAREVLLQICDGLAAIHGRGVIHRDLKPTNIMLVAAEDARPGPLVKLLDFGTAILADPEATRMTSPDLLLCTPRYASPEQLANGTLDARSDLYSLGCILYEALTGAPPFSERSDLAQLIFAKTTSPAPPVRERAVQRPDRKLDPRLLELVMALLEREPANRPRWVQEVRRVIDACA
jgi:tRNA A-37 threonylcarbamoyl transferase component Bud32